MPLSEVKKTKEKLLVFEKIRQDFVANVSHELRTPLTVIRGYLELLIDKDDIDFQNWKPKLRQMFEQSVRMEQLVADLLLLSKLESDPLDMDSKKECDIDLLLKDIIIQAKLLGKDKQQELSLQCDESLTLLGRHDELHSAFSNIVFNAVQYTPKQKKIHIIWAKENGRACFTVMDDGIGIEKKHINRLTERFYRVDKARSRENGGTGLGLAIVKHVLLRHQGNLEISSELGKGSAFKCIF